MRAFTFSEFIAAPPARVWQVLTDFDAAPKWRPLIVSMQTVDGQPLHLGSDVKIVAEFIGQRSERVSKTTAFEPGKRWTLHSGDVKTIEGWFDFILEPNGNGTRVIATCDLTAHGVLTWLFLPLIGHGEKSRRVEMLPNLKRYVESHPGTSI